MPSLAAAGRPVARRGVLAGIAAALLARPAAGQHYPNRPIRFIVPFAPGGSADQTARALATPLGAALGQTVVVDNKPGAGGTIGADLVAHAPPDGYTLLYGTPGPQIINPHLLRKLPYDPVRDFTPISGIKRAPNLLVVHPGIAAGSVAELIAVARAQPGKLHYGSSGVGSSSHLAGEMLAYMAKIEIVHVPYRGTSAALNDLLAGQIQLAIDTMSIMLPQARGGLLRALGVSTPGRSPLAPDLPAIAETLPGYDASPFNYVAAPGGTPPDIVARLNAAVTAILQDPAFRARMAELGEEPVPSTPESLAATIAAESARWKAVIDAANIRLD